MKENKKNVSIVAGGARRPEWRSVPRIPWQRACFVQYHYYCSCIRSARRLYWIEAAHILLCDLPSRSISCTQKPNAMSLERSAEYKFNGPSYRALSLSPFIVCWRIIMMINCCYWRCWPANKWTNIAEYDSCYLDDTQWLFSRDCAGCECNISSPHTLCMRRINPFKWSMCYVCSFNCVLFLGENLQCCCFGVYRRRQPTTHKSTSFSVSVSVGQSISSYSNQFIFSIQFRHVYSRFAQLQSMFSADSLCHTTNLWASVARERWDMLFNSSRFYWTDDDGRARAFGPHKLNTLNSPQRFHFHL